VAARHWDNIGSASLGLALDSDQQRAAASGIEVRHPFLDVQFIEYILAIPFRHWPPVVPYARLHREFLADYLPEAIRRRPKATFSVGVAYRMKLVWPQIRSLLFEGEWHAARFVNRERAQALIAVGEKSANRDDWPLWRGIWGIATLEAWLRRVSEYSSPHRGASRHEHPA
jgi:asparagine synthetase B (glutamine-hydrolysing)